MEIRKGHSKTAPGFALIATISVMVLLVMIALAMLSLSTIELRSRSTEAAELEAKSNARMALMLAIAEIQTSAGPDQRVTATASVLGDSVAQPHVLGVWDSMGAGREDGEGLTAANVASSYVPGRKPRFRKWLVPGPQATDFNYPESAASTGITLVGEGSLGKSHAAEDEVRMPRVAVRKGGVETGGYSWWVSGENSKARVNLFKEKAKSVAGIANTSVAAPTMALSEVTGMESLPDDKTIMRGITTGTVGFLGQEGGALPDAVKKRFHDVTVDSVGILTDTSIGGIRKDLNLALELDELPSEMQKREIYKGGPVWEDLREYYRSYKPLNEGGVIEWVGGVPRLSFGSTWTEFVSHKNWRRHLPIPTKWQWLISHYSVPAEEEDGKPQYEVRMVFDNILELWNPYTVPLTLPTDSHIDFKLWNIPYAVSYYINGQRWSRTQTKKPLYWMIRDMPSHNQRQIHNALVDLQQALMPGEVRLYSDHSETPQEARWVIDLKPGWEMSGGLFSWTLGHGGHKLVVPGNAEIEVVVESQAGFNPIWQRNEHFMDIYFVGPKGYPSEFGFFKDVVTKGSLSTTAPSLERTQDANFTASDIAGVGNKRPLAMMGMRMRTEQRIEPSSESPISDSEKAWSKHYLFTDPRQISNAVRNDNQTTLRHSGYEFFIQRINSLNDYPFVDVTADNKGFMGTSRGAREPNNGQNNVPIREIPYLPLISMGQLQNAGLGHPVPDPDSVVPPGDPDGMVPYVSYPYVANAFGNSWALPFIDADRVEQTATAPDSGGTRLLHDKCWKANEALWDSWSFSSISPQNQPLVAATDRKSMSAVLADAIAGKSPLPNSRYRFAEPRQGSVATDLAADLLGPEGYTKIGSYLVCDGAFNVNSTSVEAWKAFLASLDDRALAWLSAETGKFEQKEEVPYPVSRFTIPNGDAAKTDGFSSNQREFLRKRWEGARSLTETEIDELAQAMVEQVRLRGPFLSLGEFVNRRLVSGELGLRGALQAAIDKTSINESFATTSMDVTTTQTTGANYKNPEAARGKTGEGVPGYVTQADILMPLAPLVRVRSDTFRIRAYGEAVDRDGNVTARAYCEALVQRVPEYVDTTDPAYKDVWEGGDTSQLSVANQSFGRRIKIKSFRWLSRNEI